MRVSLRRVIDDSYDLVFTDSMIAVSRDIAMRWRDVKLFVITDNTVKRIYGRTLCAQLRDRGCDVRMFSFPAGEQSKKRATKELLEDRMIAAGATRDSLLISLGGGVVGDLAGFLAATLYRGIAHVQIPTTLLAQVDSSVGGKVGIDVPAGKNLIGAFHQPERVYIDPATLRTLPGREFTTGMAEVIKYGAILDRKLFDRLERQLHQVQERKLSALLPIVRKCCALKAGIIARDERESGMRRILNFGHTIGHAVELLSRYRLPHGFAVSIGMVCEARISRNLGLLANSEESQLTSLLSSYGLPVRIPRGMDIDQIVEATRHDKKSSGRSIRYTLLRSIGNAKIDVPLTSTDVLRLLRP